MSLEISGFKPIEENSYHCNSCHQEGDLKICGGCRKVRYCGKKCQKKDLKTHKKVCDYFLNKKEIKSERKICAEKAITPACRAKGSNKDLREINSFGPGDVQITDALIPAIVKNYPKLSHIKDWSGTQVTDNGLSLLSQLPLVHLNLADFYNITDKGLYPLRKLQLEHLDLLECGKLTDVSLFFIKDMPLRHLNLQCTNINGEGFEHLIRAPIEHLVLTFCYQLKDENFFYLGKMSHLRYLDLQGCKMSLDALKKLKELPLEFLSLDFCDNLPMSMQRCFTTRKEIVEMFQELDKLSTS